LKKWKWILREWCSRTVAVEATGTYAKQILKRLLIDLSWNSSQLEGNTYSPLDTRRLIEFGEEAQGRNRLESDRLRQRPAHPVEVPRPFTSHP
jgi:hypothetical protein